MPRRKILRKIVTPPSFKGFMPLGLESPGRPVLLGFEEYEAIRLCDYEGYHHSEAARIMQISRPTFARIYEEARRKVALAFVAGSPLLFQGGRVYYDSDWFECRRCRCRFNRIDKTDLGVQCGLCGSADVHALVHATQEERAGSLSGTVAQGQLPQDDDGSGGSPGSGKATFAGRETPESDVPPSSGPGVPGFAGGWGMGRGAGHRSGRGTGHGRRHRQGAGALSGHLCRCPQCGYETQMPAGVPCHQQVCVKCGAPMNPAAPKSSE